MGKQKFTNNATAFITSNISPTSLSFTVESAFADRFPSLSSGDWFAGTLQNASGDIEIIRVNKRDVGSNAMQNVVRAQEGTTALSFSAGETVFSVRATAAHHQDQVDHITSTAGAHTASAIAFTPTVNIDATDAQAAIEETYSDLTTAIAMASAILAASKVSITDLVGQTNTKYTSTGTAPAFVLTPTPALTAYADGQRYLVKAHAASSGAVNTLNVSGLGAINLKIYTAGGNKIDPAFGAGQLLDVMYDGTDFLVMNAVGYAEPPCDFRITATPTQAPGTRRLLVQGQAVSLTTYPTLLPLWCGALLNSNPTDPTSQADFFYRCADANNPTLTRNPTGDFLVLPPPGYFLRPVNMLTTGADASRKRYKLQEDDIKGHNHINGVTAFPNGDGTGPYGQAGAPPTTPHGGSAGSTGTYGLTSTTGGGENLVKNFGVYVWLCY